MSCYLHLLILPNEAIAARPELGVLKLHPLLHAHQFRQRELNSLVLSGLDECEWNAKSQAKTVWGPKKFSLKSRIFGLGQTNWAENL